MRRGSSTVAGALLALTILIPGAGHAADGVVVAEGLQFVPPTVVLPQGSGLLFVNADPAAAAFGNGHNVTHNVPVLQRRFSSNTINIGGNAKVNGVSALTAGDYAFVCTVHPGLMTGTLRIV